MNGILFRSALACLALLVPAWALAGTAASQGGRPQDQVDALVAGRLKELGLRPSEACSDETFVRRVFLDAIGTLPTAGEVRAFLEDRSPDKRDALVDRLLARDEFADYWAMK